MVAGGWLGWWVGGCPVTARPNLTPLGRYLDPLLIRRLEALKLRRRTARLGSGGGSHAGLMRGPGVEFRQHRFYTRGDDPRHIDWKLLARTARAHVREYDHETNLRCVLMLDASGSMNYGEVDENKFDFARRLCAALAYVLLSQQEAVGLEIVGSRAAVYVPPAQGQAQLPVVIEALDRVAPASRADFKSAAMLATSSLSRRSMVVVVSDFLQHVDEIGQTVAALRHQKHDVVLASIRHDDEGRFPFSGYLKLIGLEDEAEKNGRASDLAVVYRQRLAAHEKGLSRVAQRHACHLWRFVTNRDLATQLAAAMCGELRTDDAGGPFAGMEGGRHDRR